MTGLRNGLAALIATTTVLALAACNGGDDTSRFVFSMQGDSAQTFAASTSRTEVIERARAELAKPLEERTLHISGRIATGDGGDNPPWSWHFVPDEWDLVEVSIELCDGNPGDIEQNPAYWVDTVKTFCPWASRVAREE